MGRPSCCKPRSQAPGIAAVALIIGAGIAADKIRPEVRRIVHVTIEVLRSIAVITAITITTAIAAWVIACLIRWWLGHRDAHPGNVLQASVTACQPVGTDTGRRPCVACGGHGEVLRSDGAGRFEPRACPECQPARLAG
jgi:hypothetical protein